MGYTGINRKRMTYFALKIDGNAIETRHFIDNCRNTGQKPKEF